jgi:WD40 repeat protein
MSRKISLTTTIIAFIVCLASNAAQPPETPILVIETGAHTGVIKMVSAEASGKYILTSSPDKTARLWDDKGNLIRVFRVPRDRTATEGSLYAGAISQDGSLIALAGDTGWTFEGKNSIYLYDRSSGAMKLRIPKLPNIINHLSFSPDGRYLVCALGATGIRVFETSTGNEKFVDNSYPAEGQCSSAIFSPDGRYIATSFDDGYLRLYKAPGFSLLGKTKVMHGTIPSKLAFSPDSKALACGFFGDTAIDVFSIDAKGLVYLFSPDTSGCNRSLSAIAYSEDGNTLFAGGTWDTGGPNPLRAWEDAGRGKYRDLDIGARNTILSLTAFRGGRLLVGTMDPYWFILSPEGKVETMVKSVTVDNRTVLARMQVSEHGDVFGFKYVSTDKNLVSFSLVDRMINQEGIPSGLMSPNVSSLPVTDWKDVYSPKLNGIPLTLNKNEMSRALACNPDGSGFVLGTDWYLRYFDRTGRARWNIPIPSVAWSVNLVQNGKIVMAALGDGTIRWYFADDGKELLAFFPHADRKRWVVWTPSGYYDCSAGAEEFLGWHLNHGMDNAPDFYPISRFRSTYYRPDVIALVLETLDETVALRRADAESNKKTVETKITAALPPIVAIVSPESGFAAQSDSVTVKVVTKAPPDAPITSVKVLVDGRPEASQKGLTITPDPKAAMTLTVKIPRQNCTISVVAENRNGASEADTIRILWSGTAVEASTAAMPKLYVLAVGIGAYNDQKLQLRLPAKDAQDLVNVLREQAGKMYREVDVKLLTDKDATKDEILDGLDWIRKETTARDVAIIFFSGHGLNDPDGIFYYLPVDANLDKIKRSCVPFTDIKNTVQNLPGKAIFFIDSCHSGNVMGGRKGVQDTTAILNELSSAENGVVVFSSSTGSQFSLEKPEWNNGAFTKALVEGLSGKADFKGTGRVTVSMLDLYLSERVKELTGGAQSPVMTKPSNVPDFPVAAR